MTSHTVIEGDVIDCLKTLPDNSVHCVVTSPPYFGLRNYGVEGQIGLEGTPEDYVEKIVEVFQEVKRVLRIDGTLFLNLGDSYASNGVYIEKYKETHPDHQDLHTRNSTRYQNRKGIRGGKFRIKPKDLLGIPWLVALALRADGWYLRSDIIWHKPNPMPASVKDRPTSSHEYIFLLTKSPKYFYDANAIREPAVTREKRPQGIHRMRRYNGKLCRHKNAPAQFKKQDQTGNATYTGFNERYKNKMAQESNNLKGHSGNTRADGKPLCDGKTRNARTVWKINTKARPEAHFATFPEEIPKRCISAGTSEYGCCPKCGAPYVRIIECSGGTIGKSWHPHENDDVTGQVGGMPTKGYHREFKGWKPNCSCGAGDPVPCIVLDPFMGSGTTAKVARDLNRSSIGCELNPDYIQIYRKVLEVDSCLDNGVVRYDFRSAMA